ncbi:MAG: hemolysin III family protein [Deltaproteobacteria bacterium]|nr:hemolysin III family protein [Deltaproteobacteria bacterium]MBW2395827.1 hemolysin III family protein [Deltaproteobacteria bacterium]
MDVQRPSLGEEIASSISHGVGLVAAVLALPILTASAMERGETAEVVGAFVFATTMILLYLASTLYHALPAGPAKRVFRVIDHSAIYVFIAGSYTPFTLGVLRGDVGWALLGAVWTLALAGVVWKTTGIRVHPAWSTGLYLAMGWLVLLAIKPLAEGMPADALFWLVAGGLAYTGGVGFYAATNLRYGHFVWHLFVLAGSACHAVAVWHCAA